MTRNFRWPGISDTRLRDPAYLTANQPFQHLELRLVENVDDKAYGAGTAGMCLQT